MDHGWKITCQCGHRAPASSFMKDFDTTGQISCPKCGNRKKPPATRTLEEAVILKRVQEHLATTGNGKTNY